MYLTLSKLFMPGVFLLVTNLLVTILKARPHGSFATLPIKSLRHWSGLFFMPRLKATFAPINALCSRASPFDMLSPFGRLTIEVTPYESPPDSFTDASLQKENLGLEDLERIVRGEVAALKTHTCHLRPNNPRVRLQKIPDAQIRATNMDPGLP